MTARAPASATLGDRPSPRLRPGKLATPGDWLIQAEKLYAKHRVALGQVATNAHDEALYLLLRTLGLPLDSKPAVLRRKLTAEEQARVAEVFRRRTAGHVPAAYLTREAFLGEHRFHVDERVIIPRSYFLELLPEQIPQWLPANKPVRRAVDVCTGSGCLAILLAHQFPEAKVDASELSPDALAVARFNVATHRLAKRVKLFHSDVFDAVPAVKYDLILSNPPYVPTRELRDLPAEFKQEPAMALDGGRDGLDIIRKLLCQARDRLQPHGLVVLEVGGLRAAMDRAFPGLDLHWLHTEDGEDCVCLVQAARLINWRG
ncbi:MAG: 50S ribosomal protein L3 N(5)-glutamine methyltransferase [Opitutae bacterium]|nr:50S ribosomal protein L3 N(5)-glutamine methyltransferase [Opitutae bacterium]